MKKYDCDVCLSAGSVNQWGFCEICGEDFEDAGSRVIGGAAVPAPVAIDGGELGEVFSAVGQDAA